MIFSLQIIEWQPKNTLNNDIKKPDSDNPSDQLENTAFS